jgi:AcrR family transcriptional regulator
MTLTPWGESEELRQRQLPRGPGRSRKTVERNQRQRLLGAMVAVVAEKGYEATRVEDLVALAGVSRNAFYSRYTCKQDCFLAVVDFLAEAVADAALGSFREAEGAWDVRLTAAFARVAKLVAAQPAAAKLGLVEIYAAGPDAVEHLDRIDERAVRGVRQALRDSPEHAEMPPVLVLALLGGLRRVMYNRVREGRAAELPELVPELVDWALSYRTPPRSLRRPRKVPPELAAGETRGVDPRQRILRAVSDVVAENGYPAMAITDIADRASISLTTFYVHFESKEAAFLATLEEAQERLLALALPAVQAAESWEQGVNAASHTFFGFLATEPATAQLGGVGVWATTEAGRELRAQGMERFRVLLVEGYRLYPNTSPIASEAIGASIDALLFDTLRRKGSERVYEVAPTAAFIALAPFVDVERACELANTAPPIYFRRT